jgi:hypothetical protein
MRYDIVISSLQDFSEPQSQRKFSLEAFSSSALVYELQIYRVDLQRALLLRQTVACLARFHFKATG